MITSEGYVVIVLLIFVAGLIPELVRAERKYAQAAKTPFAVFSKLAQNERVRRNAKIREFLATDEPSGGITTPFLTFPS